MKITNDELIDIFHAYHRAKVYDSYEDKIGIIASIGSYSDLTQLEIKHNTFHSRRFDECQLLLKNLAKITDEDAIKVSKILEDESDKDLFDIEVFLDWMEDIFDTNGQTFSDYVSGNKFREVIDFLRSKGYNIGYGSYSPTDLIDAGVVKEVE